MSWEQRSKPSVYKDTKLSPPVFKTIREFCYYSDGENVILERRKEYTVEGDLYLFNIFFTML
jgi:hypothetical protein